MIMITPFDPFGLGRMRYTVKNMCAEAPEMPYDDGTTMIFLYTKGKSDGDSKELSQFLKYMECSTSENAVTEDLQQLHGMVERIKHDKEVSVRFMRLWELDEERTRKAHEEGVEEGRTLERENTEREKARAEEAERKCVELQAIIDDMKANAKL